MHLLDLEDCKKTAGGIVGGVMFGAAGLVIALPFFFLAAIGRDRPMSYNSFKTSEAMENFGGFIVATGAHIGDKIESMIWSYYSETPSSESSTE
jgi:hypothetical protein